MSFECKFLDEDGECRGKYDGFECIKEKCEYYQWKTGIVCRYKGVDGYCAKYGRFFCPGIENCDTTLEYIESLENAENGKKASCKAN